MALRQITAVARQTSTRYVPKICVNLRVLSLFPSGLHCESTKGWPKFASHLWFSNFTSNSLVAIGYAPNKLITRTPRDNVPVTVHVDTDYPFGDTVRFRIKPERDTTAKLCLRIPGWTSGATVRVEGRETGHPSPGTLWCSPTDHRWRSNQDNAVTLTIPFVMTAEPRYNGAVSIRYGPLVLSLQMEEEW
jgi:uncharacterized protein